MFAAYLAFYNIARKTKEVIFIGNQWVNGWLKRIFEKYSKNIQEIPHIFKRMIDYKDHDM